MRDKQRRRIRVVLILLVAGALAGGLVAYAPWDRGGSGSKQPTLVPKDLLDASGAQLATLLTDARKHKFHARYAVTGDPKVIGGKLEMEWWNKPDHSRIDTTRTQTDSTVRTASFINGSKGAGCQEVGSGAWSCHSIAIAAPGDPGGILTNLTSQLEGRSVTEHADTVHGVAARCFHVTGGTEPLDICTSADGVVLRNASPNVAYEISSLDDSVPSSIFDPPATVTN
jgi:hypothetical protein